MCQIFPANQQLAGPRATPPYRGMAIALTVHGGQKRQVKDLLHQHLQEANLQGTRKTQPLQQFTWIPKGSLRPRPEAQAGGAGLLWENLGAAMTPEPPSWTATRHISQPAVCTVRRGPEQGQCWSKARGEAGTGGGPRPVVYGDVTQGPRGCVTNTPGSHPAQPLWASGKPF